MQVACQRGLDQRSLSAQRLRELLHYDPDTGVFTWLVSVGSRGLKGSVAGNPKANGYLQLMIDKKTYYVHRLAWLYVHGRFPERFIDHVNGKPSDNRLTNLREASDGENSQNIHVPQSRNKAGLLGVCQTKQGWWQASLKIGDRQTYLGRFKTKDEAHHAYLTAKRKHHPFATI